MKCFLNFSILAFFMCIRSLGFACDPNPSYPEHSRYKQALITSEDELFVDYKERLWIFQEGHWHPASIVTVFDDAMVCGWWSSKQDRKPVPWTCPRCGYYNSGVSFICSKCPYPFDETYADPL